MSGLNSLAVHQRRHVQKPAPTPLLQNLETLTCQHLPALCKYYSKCVIRDEAKKGSGCDPSLSGKPTLGPLRLYLNRSTLSPHLTLPPHPSSLALLEDGSAASAEIINDDWLKTVQEIIADDTAPDLSTDHPSGSGASPSSVLCGAFQFIHASWKGFGENRSHKVFFIKFSCSLSPGQNLTLNRPSCLLFQKAWILPVNRKRSLRRFVNCNLWLLCVIRLRMPVKLAFFTRKSAPTSTLHPLPRQRRRTLPLRRQ